MRKTSDNRHTRSKKRLPTKTADKKNFWSHTVEIIPTIRSVTSFLFASVIIVFLVVIIGRDLVTPEPISLEPFAVPKEAEEKFGLSPSALASLFGSKMLQIAAAQKPQTKGQETFKSRFRSPSFVSETASAMPDIEVPVAGKISIGPFLRWIKGNPARIRGSLTQQGSNSSLQIDYAPAQHADAAVDRSFSVIVPVENSKVAAAPVLDKALLEAAQSTTQHISPFTAAWYFYTTDDTKRAVNAIKDCLNDTSEDNDTWAYNLWGVICTNNGQLRTAKEMFNRALYDPDRKIDFTSGGALTAFHNFGRLLFREGRRYEKQGKYQAAQDCFTQAASYFQRAMHDKEFALPIEFYGIVTGKLKMFAISDEAFGKAEKLLPTYVTLYIDWGNMLVDAGQMDKAIEKFQKAILLNPDAADSYIGLGKIAVRRGSYISARRHFRKGLAKYPGSSSECRLQCGDMLRRQKDFSGALTSYWNAILSDRSNSEEILKVGATAYRRIYDLGQNLKIKLREKPRDASLASSLAEAYLYLGNIPRAQLGFRHAIALDSKCADAWRGMGLVSLWHGSRKQPYHKPTQYYLKSIALNGQRGATLKEMGDWYLKEGQLKAAKRMYERAARIDQDVISSFLAQQGLLKLSRPKPLKQSNSLLQSRSWELSLRLNSKFTTSRDFSQK